MDVRHHGSVTSQDADQTFYDAVGGHAFFERLVGRFYDGVADDPVLRQLYPEEDLTGARWRFMAFLEQYWGGPTSYSQVQGHPRLRMRHAPFAVTMQGREHWLRHFRDAMDAEGMDPVHYAELWTYVERASLHMVNSHDPLAEVVPEA